MRRILTTIVLAAIATAALSSLLHTPTARASSNATVYLPLAMGGSGAQTSTPTPQPTPTHVDPAQLKADVIAAVNVERQQAGCALVTENGNLDNGAQQSSWRQQGGRARVKLRNCNPSSSLYQSAFWHTILYRALLRCTCLQSYTRERGLV